MRDNSRDVRHKAAMLLGGLVVCSNTAWADGPDYSAGVGGALVHGPAADQALARFDAGRTSFDVQTADGLRIDHRLFTLLVPEGGAVALSTAEPVTWMVDALGLNVQGERFEFDAPSGMQVIPINVRSSAGENMQINILQMDAALDPGHEDVNGYRIGTYPAEPYLDHPAYVAPETFLRVTPEIAAMRISPHFTLGQFLCKQDSDAEPHLILSARLLRKLELILAAANERGWRADTLAIMSGYRTPAYNASIGNGENSRHIYGGAADIYIDANHDGILDDLNGDGATTREDAAALFDMVEAMFGMWEDENLIGGLGEYDSTEAHGPFVHVDERGWRARWGR